MGKLLTDKFLTLNQQAAPDANALIKLNLSDRFNNDFLTTKTVIEKIITKP